MNPKKYSQIDRALQTLDKSRVFEILKDDHYLLFLFEKTERITAACYILTEMFSDSEPLKWGLRDASINLTTISLSFREKTMMQTQELKNQFFIALAKVFSLFDLAYVAYLVSPMNLSVVKKELEELQQIIENKDRTNLNPISRHFIGENFFRVSKDLFGEFIQESKGISDKISTEPGKNVVHPFFSSFNEFEKFKREQTADLKGQDTLKDIVLDKKDNLSNFATILRKGFIEEGHPNSIKKDHITVFNKLNDERKKLILDVIRKEGSAIIKDFSTIITGCSEKTIQRRLSDLVLSGVLRKEGERRWSKYYLS